MVHTVHVYTYFVDDIQFAYFDRFIINQSNAINMLKKVMEEITMRETEHNRALQTKSAHYTKTNF